MAERVPLTVEQANAVYDILVRYAVRDGETVAGLRAVIDTLIADASRLGIAFGPNLMDSDDARPNLYCQGDGEGDDTPPDGWRDLLRIEADRIGWRTPYSDGHACPNCDGVDPASCLFNPKETSHG